MRKYTLIFVLSFCIKISLGQHFYSDKQRQFTQIDALKNFAQDKTGEFQMNYQQALQLAQLNEWLISFDLPDGGVAQLVGVDANGNPLYFKTENVNSAATIQTDSLQASVVGGYNLEGSGIEIGEWDAGNPLYNHEQFNGRVTLKDNVSVSDHSTHVCGTMIGDGTGNASAKGMAPKAEVLSYDWNSDVAEMAAEAANGLILSNHSYGFVAGWIYRSNGTYGWYGDISKSTSESNYFGLYSYYTYLYDSVAFMAPYYLIVKSAGNDRNDTGPASGSHDHNGSSQKFHDSHPQDGNGGTGYDCIGTVGSAKNILTIGAVDDITSGWSQASDVVMSSFSSWGPTDDGRIKPDIVANGVSLLSSIGTSTSSYASYSGTSMAAPSVTGSLALLQELYQKTHNNEVMRAATLKGLVIHTADEAGTTNGPDYSYGWGLMNSLTAARKILEDSSKPYVIQEDSLMQNDSLVCHFISDGSGSITATICWTDPAHTYDPTEPLDDTTKMLVNDLDMYIVSDSGTYYPYKLDGSNPSAAATTGDNDVDNVEKIFISNAYPVDYYLVVKHEGPLSGNKQLYSLILSGTYPLTTTHNVGIVRVNGISNSCDSTVYPEIIIENFGDTILSGFKLSYSFNGDSSETISYKGNLNPGNMDTIYLAPYYANFSTNTFEAYTFSPNSKTDEYPENDTVTASFQIFQSADVVNSTLPYYEDFSGSFPPAGWTIGNPDSSLTWDSKSFASSCFGVDTFLYYNGFSYNAPGQNDTFSSPLYDLRNFRNAKLTFNVGYRAWGPNNFESLEIIVSDNCGYSYGSEYFKEDTVLASVKSYWLSNGSAFTPNSCSEWRTDTIDLSKYAGKLVKLSFIVTNGWGNDLFIDDISITGDACSTPAQTSQIGNADFCGSVKLDLKADPAPNSHQLQWYKNSIPLIGENDTLLTVRSAGIYQYNFSGTCKLPVSAPDTITVTSPLVNSLASRGDTGQCNSFSVDSFIYITNNNGGVLARIDDNGQDLGEITVRTYDHGSSVPAYLGESYLQRSFEIKTKFAPTSPVDVTLFFSNTEFNNLESASSSINSLNDLMITKYSGGKLGIPGNGSANAITSVTTSSGTGPGNSDAISFSTSSFSTFFIHSNSGLDPLPVELISFDGFHDPVKGNILSWEAANELNLSHYELQRSTGSGLFENIAEIPATGGTGVTQDYRFIDNTFTDDINYYRLISVDFNGESALSKIVIIKSNSFFGIDINVTPNPAHDQIMVSIDGKDDVHMELEILDAYGKKYYDHKFLHEKGVVIPLNNIEPGVYLLKVQIGNATFTEKIIKL